MCRQGSCSAQCPGAVVPTKSPCSTWSPAVTPGTTASSVLTSPSPWSTATTGRPPTDPANDTVPAATATTDVPGGAATSRPRWPGPYSVSGASHGRTTTRDAVGQTHRRRASPPSGPGARAGLSVAPGSVDPAGAPGLRPAPVPEPPRAGDTPRAAAPARTGPTRSAAAPGAVSALAASAPSAAAPAPTTAAPAPTTAGTTPRSAANTTTDRTRDQTALLMPSSSRRRPRLLIPVTGPVEAIPGLPTGAGPDGRNAVDDRRHARATARCADPTPSE